MALQLFTLNQTDDCELAICGLTNTNGSLITPDTSCEPTIDLASLTKYVVTVTDCADNTKTFDTSGAPTITATIDNCVMNGGGDIATFDISFNPGFSYTLISASYTDGTTTTTVTSFPVVGVTFNGVTQTQLTFTVTYSDTSGNIWKSTFVMDGSGIGGIPFACIELMINGKVTYKIGGDGDFLIDSTTGCINVTDDGETTLSDGVYTVVTTMYYVDSNAANQTYTYSAGYFINCSTACELYNCVVDLRSSNKEIEAIELYMLYEATNALVLCDISKACIAYDLLTEKLANCGYSDCGCN